MESRPPEMAAKKLCNMVRIAYFMIQKGISKGKCIMLDLHFMIKRGKILGKAVNELMLQHHTKLSCLPHDVHMSFVSPVPREYEFSCTTSPSYHVRRRSAHHYVRKHHARYHAPPQFYEDVGAALSSVGGDVEQESPLVGLGYGWSSSTTPVVVRQVRITDSPFTLRDADEDCHVDEEAEMFIDRFYRELRLQKWMAAAGAAGDHYR